jgi:hypothetical protein
MPRPLFDDPAQAITVTFHMTQNLALVVCWTILGCLHLLLALLVALAMWWWQVTPEQAQAAARDALASTSFVVAGAIGLSALGVLSGYVALTRWIWWKTFGQWLHGYLMRGVPRD